MTRQTGPGRRAIYPWDRWFRAGSFTLVAGDHYSCATHGMMQMVRARAAERGVRVSISMDRFRDGDDFKSDKIRVEVIQGKNALARHVEKMLVVRRRISKTSPHAE